MKLRYFLGKVKRFLLLSIANILYKKEKIIDNKIIFSNFYGKGYGEIPKYIAEKIIEENKKNNEKWGLVWLVQNNKEKFPKEIKTVKTGTLKALYEYKTAKIWVDNIRTSFKPDKKEEQIYLQTWHGSFPIKKIEKDTERTLSADYIKTAKKDGEVIDAILVDSYFQEQIYKRAFWLNKNVEYLRFGSPRTDFLINNQNNKNLKEKIKKELKIENKKIVLYAPTFRDNESIEGYKLEFENIIETFEKKYKEEFLILIKLHPNATKFEDIFKYSTKILNFNFYSDIQLLSLIADILITDYSSIFFDFIILKKPIFISAFDFKDYLKNREIYDVIYQFPFNVSYNNEELLKDIDNFNEENYIQKIEKYLKKNIYYNNGDSAEKIHEWLKNKMINK
ncbi:CDP-glycerol glycerophosphotransferase family protein [Fusobacterium gastrosuis]|uniref:CDP-glycerol glycerophosphotransferase family protein n=1 Tax=Fusobacterium gastrosuis TaxID=1755100 RepID=UPI002A964822|nr:CDP-glycerol glycerophosphotransferase family protein [Fusobacterium gastrosuis]